MALVLMGLIISLACFSLIMLYLKAVKPLIALGAQAQKALQDSSPLDLKSTGGECAEVRALVAVVNKLLQKSTKERPDALSHERREAEFSGIINEATNRLNGIINYAQLLLDDREAENYGGRNTELLEKIIKDGEQCAVVLRSGRQ
jgi:signal transduction histidine kinase